MDDLKNSFAVAPALETPPVHSGRAGTLIAKALMFAGLAVLIGESIWRILGYQPAGSDIRRFAVLHASAMNDANVVALVGSSRVRCGLKPDVLDAQVPGRRFVQLGILGNSGMPVLQDLADDPAFRGSVICEFHPAHWLQGNYPFVGAPEPLAYTHPHWSGAYVEMFLGEHLRDWFSFYSYNMVTEFPRILQHKPIPPPERPDRFLAYREISPVADNAQLKLWLRATQKAGEQVAASGPGNIPGMVPIWVEKIRDRGGRVLFVRMPVDGELRTLEERVFPQTAALMENLRKQGLDLIDFADMPTHYRCPDGSHLAPAEATRFSTALAQLAAARGFFAGR